MNNFKITTLSLISLLMLSGCVSRTTADEKLAKGCKAAAEILVEEGFKIKNIKENTFKTTSTQSGSDFREVTINAEETNDYFDREETYTCLFAEELGPFGISYDASLYQIKIYGNQFGMDSGTSLNSDIKDHFKINEAAKNAMKD